MRINISILQYIETHLLSQIFSRIQNRMLTHWHIALHVKLHSTETLHAMQLHTAVKQIFTEQGNNYRPVFFSCTLASVTVRLKDSRTSLCEQWCWKVPVGSEP